MNKYFFLKIRHWQLFLIFLVFSAIPSLAIVGLAVWWLWLISIAYWGAIKLGENRQFTWLFIRANILLLVVTVIASVLGDGVNISFSSENPPISVLDYLLLICAVISTLLFVGFISLTANIYYRLTRPSVPVYWYNYIKFYGIAIIYIIGVWIIQPNINEIDFTPSPNE